MEAPGRPGRKSLEKADRFASLLFLIFSGLYLGAALFLPLGTLMRPGPGLIPVIAGSLLTLLTLVHFLQVSFFKKTCPGGEALPARGDFLRVSGIMIVLGFYGAFQGLLGFTVTSTILVSLVLRLLGMRRWSRILPLALLMSAGSRFLFKSILEVPLPGGIGF